MIANKRETLRCLIATISIVVLILLLIGSPICIVLSWKSIIVGIIMGCALPFFNMSVTKIISIICPKHLFTKSQIHKIKKEKNIIFSILTIILLAFSEELLFRSYLLNFFISHLNINVWGSIVMEAIVFALLHFNNRFVELFIMALTFSVSTIFMSNLFPAIVGHALNNLIIFIRVNRRQYNCRCS